MLQRPESAIRTAEGQPREQIPSSAHSPSAPSNAVIGSRPQGAKRGGQRVAEQQPQPARSGANGDAADDLEALLDRLQLASGRSAAAADAEAAAAASRLAAGELSKVSALPCPRLPVTLPPLLNSPSCSHAMPRMSLVPAVMLSPCTPCL